MIVVLKSDQQLNSCISVIVITVVVWNVCQIWKRPIFSSIVHVCLQMLCKFRLVLDTGF